MVVSLWRCRSSSTRWADTPWSVGFCKQIRADPEPGRKHWHLLSLAAHTAHWATACLHAHRRLASGISTRSYLLTARSVWTWPQMTEGMNLFLSLSLFLSKGPFNHETQTNLERKNTLIMIPCGSFRKRFFRQIYGLFHLILWDALRGKYCVYPHFTDQ